MIDARHTSPAARRNRDPLLAVLRDVLPPRGTILEVASGGGEHAIHFARALPALTWQPSDPAPQARASIAAWADDAALPNLLPPLALDAAAMTWPVAHADAVLCINMIHISPWAAAVGLMRGAGRLLAPGAPLMLYGPFRQAGVALAPGNAAFDVDLRRRDPAWGLRDLTEVVAIAAAHGFVREGVIDMPADNLSVIFRRR